MFDFNTAGQLGNNFNQSATNTNITQSTNTGISGSGAINVTNVNTYDVFATTNGYSLGNVGSVYTFTSFIKSVWNNGYSGLGFCVSSPATAATIGSTYRPTICLGISVHGGGFIFHNNSTDWGGNWLSGGSGITPVINSPIFDLLNEGSPDDWYKIVFIITQATSTTFNMRVEVWPSSSSGILLRPLQADAIYEVNGVTNSTITSAPLLYGYFSFSGTRVSDFDNYAINLSGGGTIVEPGAPVVLTTGSSLASNAVTVSGNVTSENGAPVTERGIVYGASQNPTISNNKIIDGSGLGTFDVTTPSLSPGTYYLRTYATNSAATSYGSEVDYTIASPVPLDPTSVTASENPICAGFSTQLTANGAIGTVYWYTGSCGGTQIGTGNTIIVSPSSTTTYFARNYNNSQYSTGCASLEITVNTPSYTPIVHTVAELQATGTSVQWYASSTGGTPLLPSSPVENGTHYYATQTVGGLESTSRLDIVANLDPTPCKPTGNATQSYAPGSTVASLQAVGSNIRWYAASSGGSALSPSTVLVNGTPYYASQTIDCTESATRLQVTVTLN